MSAAVTSTLVTGSAATTNRRTGVGEFAAASRHTLLEQLGVGKEQRRIPAKEDQPGYLARVGIARDVMVALDAFGAAQHRRMRTPTVPEEFDDGDHDRQPDARDSTENGHPHETDNGQPELPTLDAIDADKVGDLDQADSRGDNDSS